MACVAAQADVAGPLPSSASSPSGAQSASASDEGRIVHAMKAQFDKPESPLEVGPVSVLGDFAVAGWTQGGRGGRTLLHRADGGWQIHVCGGDGLTRASSLEMAGMSAADARSLAARVVRAERLVPAARVKLFSLFKGTVHVNGAEHHVHEPMHRH